MLALVIQFISPPWFRKVWLHDRKTIVLYTCNTLLAKFHLIMSNIYALATLELPPYKMRNKRNNGTSWLPRHQSFAPTTGL